MSIIVNRYWQGKVRKTSDEYQAKWLIAKTTTKYRRTTK